MFILKAAEFMSARLRDEFMASGSTLKNVHIMIGEAHDFYLRDPTNLVQYAGTVSFQAKVKNIFLTKNFFYF